MKKREELQVNVAGLRRNIKNLAHNYSEAQVKVREATSNDHWGPSSTLMSEIADLTYNMVAFTEIMQMIWKRLNDHGRNWRHVYKALLLLEYLIKTGSEKVAQQCKENIYAIRTLRDFQHSEDGKDPGLNVREKAKQLCLLLKDDERLRNERIRAIKAKERFAQSATGFGSDTPYELESPSSPRIPPAKESYPSSVSTHIPTKAELENARPQTVGEEELQLQLALAMSREEAEQEEQKRRSDDVRLQLALSQSEQEFKQTAVPRSHLNDLLEIDPSIGLGSQPPLVDPWGMPISAPSTSAASLSANQHDAWGSSPLSPPLSISLQSSIKGSSVAADPWAPSDSSMNNNFSNKSEDPWRTISPKMTNISSPSPPNIPARPVVDPWIATPPTMANEEDEFAAITNRNTSNSHHNGGGCVSPDPFDLASLENGLSPSPVPGQTNGRNNSPHTEGIRKTPQSFLGENSALVNLDNLITVPTVPPLPVMTQKTGPANPFGSASRSTLYNKTAGNQPIAAGGSGMFQGDPFHPVQPKNSNNGLPQPLLPQPNPFLS